MALQNSGGGAWTHAISRPVKSSEVDTSGTYAVLVTEDVLPAAFIQGLESDYGDLRAGTTNDPSTATELPLEIHHIDRTAGTIRAYVRRLLSSSSDTDIVFFRGNSSATEAAAGAATGRNAVWQGLGESSDVDFQGVYHFGSRDRTLDSTGNGYDLTEQGSPAYNTQAGVTLNGSSQHFDLSPAPFIAMAAAQSGTILARARAASLAADQNLLTCGSVDADRRPTVLWVDIGGAGAGWAGPWDDYPDRINWGSMDDINATTAYVQTVVSDFNAGTARMRVDGVAGSTETIEGFEINQPLASSATYIGMYRDTNRFSGDVEEIWYADGVFSTDWLDTVHTSLNTPSTFFDTTASEQSVGGTAVTVTNVVISGNTLTLTTDSAIASGATVTLDYTPGVAPLKAADGEAVGGFSQGLSEAG